MANQAHGLLNSYGYRGVHRRGPGCLKKLVWSERYRGHFWVRFR